MKFGIFYEHQLPRPWRDGDEHRIYREALDQVELAIASASTMPGRSSTISSRSIRIPRRRRFSSRRARSAPGRFVSATASC
jgi:hypothetical protein